MVKNRTNGIVFHPTSLPGKGGIGDLGGEIYLWLDALARAGVGVWQILPLGPTGSTNSPYQSYSSFAGNPLLIHLEELVSDGLLHADELGTEPAFPVDRVDFEGVRQWKQPLISLAAKRFSNEGAQEISLFESASPWLHDFARFMAIGQHLGTRDWTAWPLPLCHRDEGALAEMDARLSEEISEAKATQFLFYRQWEKVSRYAQERNIQIMGDLPIYVGHHSADVWAHPALFELDECGGMAAQAGAPPGRFSAVGQLWEMPLYRWDMHEKEGFSWWGSRMRAVAKLTPLVRFDHFNGVQRYWRVPNDAETAAEGAWVPGPGAGLLNALFKEVEGLSLVAEDLGVTTPGVPELLHSFGIPGMRVMQFGFESDELDPSLPAQFPEGCGGYTSTHDTPTNHGWFNGLSPREKEEVLARLGTDGTDISWDLIEAVWGSRGVLAVTQLQDLLDLDDGSRMNVPGVRDGNWAWRASEEALGGNWIDRLRRLNEKTGR